MMLLLAQEGIAQDGLFQEIEIPAPDVQQPYVPVWLVEIEADA